jgi:hypothetical protein
MIKSLRNYYVVYDMVREIDDAYMQRGGVCSFVTFGVVLVVGYLCGCVRRDEGRGWSLDWTVIGLFGPFAGCSSSCCVTYSIP